MGGQAALPIEYKDVIQGGRPPCGRGLAKAEGFSPEPGSEFWVYFGGFQLTILLCFIY